MPLLLGEVLLALFDPSWATLRDDLLVGFSETKPLFELNQASNAFVMREDRLRAFVQNGFSAHKQSNTFRIFCLGGSTVQGRPYSIETSFTTWLRLSLETACPDRSFEVINAGGVSYASYRLASILEECLQYEPDLIVLCTGNNEFLEDRSYAVTKKTLPVMEPVLNLLSHSRIARSAMAIGTKWTRSERMSASLGPEVRAMLDYERGMERYRRNEPWRRSVEAHFRINVQKMIDTCKNAHVPIMLLSPCVNLKDAPPFKSQHRDDIQPATLRQWEQHMATASEELTSGNKTRALKHLQQAIELDPNYALTWYSAGHALYQSGKFQQAKECFERALFEDICPLRIRPDMRTALAEMVQKEKIPFYDLQEPARQSSPSGIAGSEFLVDHVHPSISGHQTIGKELAIRIRDRWLKDPSPPDLPIKLSDRFQTQLDALPDHYFANGLQRLQNLRAWTQGRADGAPIETLPKPEHGL